MEVVITKRNKPVAKLVPINDSSTREQQALARLRGRGRMLVSAEEFIQPIPNAGWPDVAMEP
ncbi:MAG: hypothetical protein A2341_05585 [Deltaproteobacteria bacterium RIFOXYB12_FULL_58_9]|nr:MAG: hypothetical protein A2341_05585 [Deltaproteobacteria bacterium RIFOXYB12_FULL_58_9]